MSNETLFTNLNRSVQSSAGYTHYQISRATMVQLRDLAKNNPAALAKLFDLCISVRGEDRRKSK
jgi:hypothetical protein